MVSPNAPTPRNLWGTCCPDDPECEHSFLTSDELSTYMDTPLFGDPRSSFEIDQEQRAVEPNDA